MKFSVFSLLSLLLLPVMLMANSPLVVIMLGPPASGKGTQGIQIAQALHVPHISTGDLFRENMKQNTPLGQRAKSYIDAGNLVPDELVLDMLFDRISKGDATKGYVLDGFPRTLPQAKAFENKIPKNSTIIAFNLVVSDETIIKRALERKRADDTPEVIKARLQVYYKETAPLIDYYSKKGVLHPIDSEKAPDEVFKALMQVLKSEQICH